VSHLLARDARSATRSPGTARREGTPNRLGSLSCPVKAEVPRAPGSKVYCDAIGEGHVSAIVPDKVGSGRDRNRLLRFVLTAGFATFLAYVIVLRLTNDASAVSEILSALSSVVPLILLGLAVRSSTRLWVFGRPLAWQLLYHGILAIAFAAFWYWAVMVLLALTSGKSLLDFDVRAFFPGRAVAWQLLQGLTFYSLAVALTYLEALLDSTASAFVTLAETATPASTEHKAAADDRLSRYFIRRGEEIQPVDVRTIVSISGAGDYTEICTLDGRHLARMSLAEFEAKLGTQRFVRVHRSRIVNLDRVARAEPAGSGRILLHMENGESVLASRSGTRLFRQRVI